MVLEDVNTGLFARFVKTDGQTSPEFPFYGLEALFSLTDSAVKSYLLLCTHVYVLTCVLTHRHSHICQPTPH